MARILLTTGVLMIIGNAVSYAMPTVEFSPSKVARSVLMKPYAYVWLAGYYEGYRDGSTGGKNALDEFHLSRNQQKIVEYILPAPSVSLFVNPDIWTTQSDTGIEQLPPLTDSRDFILTTTFFHQGEKSVARGTIKRSPSRVWAEFKDGVAEAHEIVAEFEFQDQRFASILRVTKDLRKAIVMKHYMIDPMIVDLSLRGWDHTFSYEWELFLDDVSYLLYLEHIGRGVFGISLKKNVT